MIDFSGGLELLLRLRFEAIFLCGPQYMTPISRRRREKGACIAAWEYVAVFIAKPVQREVYHTSLK